MMLSQFNKTTHLYKYSYFLTNPKCFFHRYCDTGFKTKWTGFWKGNKKFIEFFAFKVGSEYLSESNCIKTLYNFVKAEHTHELNGRLFKQSVFVPRNKAVLVLELTGEKNSALKAELELAINMRFREENLHARQYSIKKKKNAFEITSELGKLIVKPLSGSMVFESKPSYKSHAPSNEPQCYFLPGRIYLKGDRIRLMLSADSVQKYNNREPGLKKNYYEKLCSIIECSDPFIESSFRNALLNLEMLYAGRGFYAGLPWFLQFWARDTFWSFKALLFAGMFERAKVALLEFVKRMKDGRIPNYIAYNETSYNSIDSNPLFISALKDYVLFSADYAFLKKALQKAKQCIEALLSLQDSDGFIMHDLDANETWMDTLNRREKAIEVQALFITALRDFAELSSMLKKPNRKISELAEQCKLSKEELLRGFEKTFYDDSAKLLADRIFYGKKDLIKRPNALVALMLGISKRKELLKLYESPEFLSEKGLRSISKLEANYSPNAYHNGQVWSLCTAWLACSEFALGRPSKGLGILKLLCKDFERDALGCIGETWNAETATLAGCGLQLWGSAFVIKTIDEFMLGIHPNAFKKEVVVRPRLPNTIKRIKRVVRVGKKRYAIEIKNSGSKQRIRTSKGIKLVKGL